jgi:4-hydroxy-tetrahydrodipicolinate synthase
MRTPRIADVVPAVLTPFHDDLSIDGDSLQKLITWMLEVEGIGAIFCTGHAGEVASLSREERQIVVRLTAEAVDGRVPVIAGVYTDSITDAIAMARDARAAGAAAVTIFPPPIFADGATESSEMPFRWFDTIVREAETPVIIFQFSRDTGLAYTADTLERLATLPEVVAIKEGSGDMAAYELNYRLLSRADPPVPVLTSNNSWLLASLAVGADGILSGSSNVVARKHAELWRAVQAGDLSRARTINDLLYPLVKAFYRAPFINMHTRMKEALVMMNVLPRATVRAPLLPISDSERAQIRQSLASAQLL